jgi:hypothetical protein
MLQVTVCAASMTPLAQFATAGPLPSASTAPDRAMIEGV